MTTTMRMILVEFRERLPPFWMVVLRIWSTTPLMEWPIWAACYYLPSAFGSRFDSTSSTSVSSASVLLDVTTLERMVLVLRAVSLVTVLSSEVRKAS